MKRRLTITKKNKFKFKKHFSDGDSIISLEKSIDDFLPSLEKNSFKNSTSTRCPLISNQNSLNLNLNSLKKNSKINNAKNEFGIGPKLDFIKNNFWKNNFTKCENLI